MGSYSPISRPNNGLCPAALQPKKSSNLYEMKRVIPGLTASALSSRWYDFNIF
jgi:hypothetical protein